MSSQSKPRRPWPEELAIIDRLMRDVSKVSDPQELVRIYSDGIDELFPVEEWMAVSLRGVTAPDYLITRSSRFEREYNPWKERDKLPVLRGGILGEIAYANKPVIIEDLPAVLKKDDPGYFFLSGIQSLFSMPHYDDGVGLNIAIMMFKPGVAWDRTMIPMFHWQANLFGRGTHNLVLRQQLEQTMAELDAELKIVGKIQRSLLPQSLPQIPGYELAAHYETSARAGGDYYDFFPLGDGAWGLFIADVAGHGTPAAVLMAVTHAIAHTRPGPPHPPSEVLAHINRHLTRSYTSDGTFVTAFYAVLRPDKNTLTYASAGHNPPRLLRKECSGCYALDAVAGLPLGIDDDVTFKDTTVSLYPGDHLVLYTDGVTEAMAPATLDAKPNDPRDLYGTDRLDALLRERPRTAEEIISAIQEALARFTGNTPSTDDRTLVILRAL